MRNFPAFFEQAFTALALMLYSGGPLNVILSGGFSQGDRAVAPPDFALTRSLFLLTYAVFFGLLLLRWKKVLVVMQRDRFIWTMVGFACLSFFWSDLRNETLPESIALVGTTFFGIYFATRYTLKQQLQILGWTFGLVIFLSLVYALALPKYGIMSGVHAGAWRGIYTHKNVLGQMMVLSSVVFLLLMRDRRYHGLFSLGLMLSIALLVLSTSRGAMVNVTTLMCAIALCRIFRLHYRLLVVLLGTLLLLGGSISYWVTDNLEMLVVDVLGKDLTLTGRTTLWQAAIEMIQQRPWLGYGYDAFWHGWDSAAAYIWRLEAWPAPHAHNGFVDLTLHLGLIGLSIFLIGFFGNFLKGLIQFRMTSGSEFVWPILYLIYVILTNIGESSLLRSGDVFWVLYASVSLSMLMPPEEQPHGSESQEYWLLEESTNFRTGI